MNENIFAQKSAASTHAASVDLTTLGSDLVVFAPHIDDEVIGCWRLLEARKVSEVVYFYDLTPDRRVEAENCGTKYGFKPTFYEEGMGVLKFAPGVVILAPNIRDSHHQHKKVNQFAKRHSNRKLYYSVDMNTGRSITLPSPHLKGLDLLTLFPSQSALFNSDQKYHLFEDLCASDLKTTVTINTQFEGIHAYPAAPEGVEFLRHPHRHMFHVKVELEVFHDDREVEFILLKREVEAYIRNNMQDLQFKSCEMLGEMFMGYVTGNYEGRSCTVCVFEDQENGATVKFEYV